MLLCLFLIIYVHLILNNERVDFNQTKNDSLFFKLEEDSKVILYYDLKQVKKTAFNFPLVAKRTFCLL